MIDWKMFAVCLFAIAASYLIASIPLAQAAQVTITDKYGNNPLTASYSPESYVNKQVSVDGDGNVRIQVSNGSVNSIDAVYIYKCKGKDPSECSEHVAPVSLAGNIDVTYHWSDIKDGDNYPQTANIMLIAHTSDAGGGRWLAFWNHGTKTASNRPYMMVDTSISSISITAKSVDYVPLIKSFIDIKGMLPMSAWISKIIFTGALGFHDLNAVTPPATTNQTYYTGDSLNNITGDKAFIFPYNGAYILNGITLSGTPNYVTGDGICSPEESASSDILKCLDCGSPSGYYCDISKGNKQLNSISLSVYGSPSIKVSNCNIQNTVTISFTINNQPTGTTITSAQYALNGSATQQASLCTPAGSGIYNCNITTPAVPGCSGTDYVLNPNSMTFAIRFNNASAYITKSIQSSFPAVTVGSWTCGQFGCETSLGESQANCCYDCGCASSQYCDFAAGMPATSTCKTPVSNSDLRVVSVNPVNFYTHNSIAGDNVEMGMHIMNAPQSISVSSVGCKVSDCLKSGLPCSASCSVLCAPQPSTNPNIYNSTCLMNFKIQGYDLLQNYSIYPIINYSISYSNGTGSPISSLIETSAPVISVGSHWKGDGKCDPDESYATACFDCPCPPNQYCDSSSRTFFSPSDSCKPVSDLNITLDSVTSTSFVDSSIGHIIFVSARTNGKPHGLIAAGTCSFSNSADPACSMSCSTNEASSDYGIECSIGIPAINYKTSPFYDSVARKIMLGSNSFSITLLFNNGSAVSNVSANFPLGGIAIDVVPHCGDGACDSDIGESSSGCCIDCNCSSGMFCYGGVANGQCLDNSAVSLFINKTDPTGLNCTIAEYKGKCQFVEPVDIYADIVNVPVGARIISSSYKIDNSSYDINCFASPIGQNGKYICSTALPEIEGGNGGNISKQLELLFTISYKNNGTAVTRNITANATINIDRQKSERVLSCEQAIREVKSAQAKVSSKKGVLIGFLAAAGALAVFTCAMAVHCCAEHVHCGFSCGFWVFVCGLALALVGCIGGMLNSALEQAKQTLTQVEQKKAQLCASSDPASMSAAIQGAKSAGSSGLGTILGIVCAVGIMVAMYGAFQMLAAAQPPAAGAQGGFVSQSHVIYTSEGALTVPEGSAYAVSGDTMAIMTPEGAGMTVTSDGLVTSTWYTPNVLATPEMAAAHLPAPAGAI